MTIEFKMPQPDVGYDCDPYTGYCRYDKPVDRWVEEKYYNEETVKQAMCDILEQAAQLCEKQDGEHDHVYSLAIRTMIKEFKEFNDQNNN